MADVAKVRCCPFTLPKLSMVYLSLHNTHFDANWTTEACTCRIKDACVDVFFYRTMAVRQRKRTSWRRLASVSVPAAGRHAPRATSNTKTTTTHNWHGRRRRAAERAVGVSVLRGAGAAAISARDSLGCS